MRPPFDALSVLKSFHDAKELKHLYAVAPDLETHCFHTYSYSDFFRAAIGGNLAYYYEYQSERDWEYGVVKAYYSHAAMDDYYWLAKEYGSRHGLSEKKNPYFIDFQEYLESFLFPDDYTVSWLLVTNAKKPKGCGLVFGFEPEYSDTQEFIYNIFMIWNRYIEKSKDLRRVLAEETASVDQEQDWKEAA